MRKEIIHSEQNESEEQILITFRRNDVLMIGTLVEWIASQHESEFDVFGDELSAAGANVEGVKMLPGLMEKFYAPSYYGLDEEIADIRLTRKEAEYLGVKLSQAQEFGFDARPEYATLNFQYKFQTGKYVDIYKDLVDEFGQYGDLTSRT